MGPCPLKDSTNRCAQECTAKGQDPPSRLATHVGPKAILMQGVWVDTVLEFLLDFCFLSFLVTIFCHGILIYVN